MLACLARGAGVGNLSKFSNTPRSSPSSSATFSVGLGAASVLLGALASDGHHPQQATQDGVLGMFAGLTRGPNRGKDVG